MDGKTDLRIDDATTAGAVAELAVLGNGTTARVTGQGIDGEFDMIALRAIMLDLLGRARVRFEYV